ncbi:MAG: molybdopterin-guanine dinucleotide biosynthesis protein B [Candidatus Acetothermia bacterium]
MPKSPIIGIYGNSDSGKTRLIEELLEKLKAEDYSLATIKHTLEEASLSPRGKDSWRHLQAGARLTALAADNGTHLAFAERCSPEKLFDLIQEVGKWDLVLVEGYKEHPFPKIAVGTIDSRDYTIYRYRGNLTECVEAIEKEMEVQKIAAELGEIDCGKCGFPDCHTMAEEIVAGNQNREDCLSLPTEQLTVCVNGKTLGLSDFPRDLIRGTVKGMMRSLKGVDKEVKSATIEIDDPD